MKVENGSVIEISLGSTYFYVQVLKRAQQMGDLLRVIEGAWETPVQEVDSLSAQPTKFYLFLATSRALKDQRFRLRGSTAVPPSESAFPTFRSGMPNPRTGKVENWWLWDGDKEWNVGTLSPEQQKLSPDGTWDSELLLQKLSQGWRPEDDFR